MLGQKLFSDPFKPWRYVTEACRHLGDWWLLEATRFNEEFIAAKLFNDGEYLAIITPTEGGSTISLSLLPITGSTHAAIARSSPFRRHDLPEVIDRHGLNPRRVGLCLQIPSSLVYTRSRTVSVQIKKDVEKIAPLEISRQTPFTDANSIIHCRTHRDTVDHTKLVISHSIVVRSTVSALCEKAGVEFSDLDYLCVAGAGPTLNDISSTLIPVSLRQPNRSKLKRTVVAALIICALLLSAANVYADWTAQRTVVAKLKTEIATESAAIPEVRRLNERFKLIDEARRTVESFQKAPRVSEIINDLSANLPDGTWLTEMHLAGRELSISGYSSNSSPLISSISASRLISNARFDAPVTKTVGSSVERFSIRCIIRDIADQGGPAHG